MLYFNESEYWLTEFSSDWENTAIDFIQEILAELMKEAKHLGVGMFLLDDGWFGNKYPRKDDSAGLGDWEVTHVSQRGISVLPLSSFYTRKVDNYLQNQYKKISKSPKNINFSSNSNIKYN